MDRRTRGGGGFFEGAYRLLMRRNSVYVTFIVVGAFFGERVPVYKYWKRYEDIPVLGTRTSES
ncbi:hypothetical protein AMTRI_Chr02g266350 [Amborella trichopoda]